MPSRNHDPDARAVLVRWQEVERLLEGTDAESAARKQLEAQAATLRALYRSYSNQR